MATGVEGRGLSPTDRASTSSRRGLRQLAARHEAQFPLKIGHHLGLVGKNTIPEGGLPVDLWLVALDERGGQSFIHRDLEVER